MNGGFSCLLGHVNSTISGRWLMDATVLVRKEPRRDPIIIKSPLMSIAHSSTGWVSNIRLVWCYLASSTDLVSLITMTFICPG